MDAVPICPPHYWIVNVFNSEMVCKNCDEHRDVPMKVRMGHDDKLSPLVRRTDDPFKAVRRNLKTNNKRYRFA